MLGKLGGPFVSPRDGVSQHVHVGVEDLDEHFDQAKRHGARVLKNKIKVGLGTWDLGFGIWDLPTLRSVLVEVIVDGEVDAKRRHRPEARGGNLVVFRAHRQVPRADSCNVNQSTDRYHAHRSVVHRLQQRILLPNPIELESMVGSNPVGGCGATRSDGGPIQAPSRLILGGCPRRKDDCDKQSCRHNWEQSTVKHAATIGRNVLLL
jgi:hypothetical protein